MKLYNYGVFIGRFQPLHLGHEFLIKSALDKVERLIILVGSSNCASDPRNPFSYSERLEMFDRAFKHEISTGKLLFKPLQDFPYSDTAWCSQVQNAVNETVLEHQNDNGIVLHGLKDIKIALTGFGKDKTSYYLKLFPEWDNIQIDSQFGTFSSTDIRNQFFQNIPVIPQSVLSDGVAQWLDSYKMTDDFKKTLSEVEYLEDYPKHWGKGPFITADAVVIQAGHILLIERRNLPGRGLLALPGGFLDSHETIKTAAVRELKEETLISDHKGELPPAMLESFIDDSKTRVFDYPNRSLRGRIITHAFLFHLPKRRDLFTVKGSDDACNAQWYRLGDLKPEYFFEDHWSIINLMADL